MGSTSEKTKSQHVTEGIPAERLSSPVVSVVAADLDIGTVARTILRANEHGFVTFVVVPESDDSRIGTLAERLDAVVLESDFSDGQAPLETVERVARALGFPAVLHFDDSDSRVDFARCEAVADETDDYSIEAPLVDSRTRAVDTVAAIPAYNEAETIESVVGAVERYVDEVLVVDDGSVDDTVAAAERAGATVVEHATNRGYGAALQTAFSEADDRDADALVTLDGDGQHDPEDVPKLLETQRETDANVVVGNRFHDGASHHVPRYRRAGLFVINLLTNISLGRSPTQSWVSDTQSGFRAFDGEAISSLAADDALSDNMSATTDIFYHARRKGYDIEEIDTTIFYEGDETSTQNPLRHGLAVVSNILRTVERERPLTFVGLPGITAVLLGSGLGYWAVANYARTGTLPTGLVLFCIFSTFLGVLLSFTSIILHSIQTHVGALADGSVPRGVDPTLRSDTRRRTGQE